MYDVVLFDLDGTLTNSSPGIINSVEYTLKKYNIEDYDRSLLYKFIGPPLVDSFKMYFNLPEGELMNAVRIYREYYAEKGIFENKVYDGIEEMLRELKSHGKKVLVATSKPEVFAKRIFDHFDLTKYLDFVGGSKMDETRGTKSEVIEYSLSQAGITDRSRAIMVGDREHDIIGAKKTGLDSIGILYGFGSREELENAGATYIAETPEEIVRLIIGNNR